MSRSAFSSRWSVRASTAAVVAELAGQLLQVEVVHPRTAVRLGELLGEVVEVGEVLEHAGAVAEAEPLLPVEAFGPAPVLAGAQRLEVPVELGERLHQLGAAERLGLARASSSSRCSWVIELRIRWAAAARWARESSSSSTLRGFSGK